MRTEVVDVAVIGGGPAGLAAASAAKDTGAERVLLIERDERLGGILNQCIHDGFGTKVLNESLTGPEYAQVYIDKLEQAKVTTCLNTMVLDLTPERVLTVCSAEGLRRISAGAVVLAMGCRERTRGALGIPGPRPAGVYTAGVVQNYMNLRNIMVGRRFVVLGSGDIGLIMARRLTLEGAKVECVAEILPYPSGLSRNVVQCLEDFGIPLYLNTTVVKIHGTDRVTGVTLADVGPKWGIKRGSQRFVECDTLMLSVGLIPENELSKRAGVALSPVTAGAVVDDWFQTSVPGIFSCGNVLHVHDVVDYVTLEAETAGRNAARYSATGSLPPTPIKVKPGKGVRYVLPYQVSGTEAVEFSLRVLAPERDRHVTFRSNGEVIRRMRELVVAPAQMLRVKLRADRFPKEGEITVEVTP